MFTPVSVDARFAEDGEVTILRFTWQGRTLPVTSMGRKWGETGATHYLVMAPGERMFELTWNWANRRWAAEEISKTRKV